jgi:hypothetical protein
MGRMYDTGNKTLSALAQQVLLLSDFPSVPSPFHDRFHKKDFCGILVFLIDILHGNLHKHLTRHTSQASLFLVRLLTSHEVLCLSFPAEA